MKKRSNKTYYNYVKCLLEGDSAAIKAPIKADDPQLGQMILGASAGGVGAVACLKYLDNTFSISSLQTAVKSLTKYSEDIAKLAKKGKAGIWSRALGKLSSLVGTALKWVQTSCTSILKRFPSLHEPIFSGSSAMNIGNSAPTYGSVFCMALAAAAVGTVLYKIYKFIKGKRNKTESVAMYNFRKNYELSVMLDETAVFFNKLDKLIEAPLNTKDLNWLAQRAVAWDNKNPDPNSSRVAYGGSTKDALAARHAEFERQRTLAAADAERKALVQQQIKANQNRMAGRFGVELPQDKVAAARQAAMDKEYLKGASERFKAYNTTDPNATRMTYTNAPKRTQWTNPTPKIDINNVDTSTLSPSAAKAVQQARAATHNAAIQDIKDRTAMAKRAAKYGYSDPNLARITTTDTQYIQLSNGKVQALTKDPSTGKLVGRILSRNDVPRGSVIVNSPKLQNDVSAMNARAAKYAVSDPNLARMSTVDTQYIQLSNGKVQALTKDPSTGKLVGKMMSRTDVPKGSTIVNSPKLAKIAAQRAGTDAGEAARLAKADFAGMNARYAGPDANAVRAGAFGKAGETSQAIKDIGNSPSKAESFIDSVRENVNKMWTTSKDWCKNNPRLVTMIAIVAALIACWFGVKKYRDSKAKKQQADQQITAATA